MRGLEKGSLKAHKTCLRLAYGMHVDLLHLLIMAGCLFCLYYSRWAHPRVELDFVLPALMRSQDGLLLDNLSQYILHSD